MSEDIKRLTVDQAVEDLMARDTQYREELRRQVDQKLDTAEKKRNCEGKKRFLTISESNRYFFCLWFCAICN
jgi:hypothetical protein